MPSETQSAVDVAQELFLNRRVTYLDVVLAKLGTLDAGVTLVQAHLLERKTNIALCRALGGGE